MHSTAARTRAHRLAISIYYIYSPCSSDALFPHRDLGYNLADLLPHRLFYSSHLGDVVFSARRDRPRFRSTWDVPRKGVVVRLMMLGVLGADGRCAGALGGACLHSSPVRSLLRRPRPVPAISLLIPGSCRADRCERGSLSSRTVPCAPVCGTRDHSKLPVQCRCSCPSYSDTPGLSLRPHRPPSHVVILCPRLQPLADVVLSRPTHDPPSRSCRARHTLVTNSGSLANLSRPRSSLFVSCRPPSPRVALGVISICAAASAQLPSSSARHTRARAGGRPVDPSALRRRCRVAP